MLIPTAILIFTQEASKEASRKMLTPSKNKGVNQLVFTKLNHFVGQTATAAASDSTKLTIFHSNQLISTNESSFGKQLSLAVQSVFEKGFEKVICVGNDCPALNKNRILEAAKKLQNTDTVLGPDNRGGVYLLGISRKDFQPEVFENLAWQSEKMLESYIEQATNQSISILEALSDIHSFQELQAYTTSKYFIAFLLQIVEQTILKIQDFYLNLIEKSLTRSLSLRAPPVA